MWDHSILSFLMKFMSDIWATFIFNMFKAGLMVSVDAAVFMVAVILLIDAKYRWAVVFFITIAHAIYGYLGLSVMAGILTPFMGISIVLASAGYLGIRFVIQGLIADEEGNPYIQAAIINAGLLSLMAIGLYSGVSIDEFFVVLQRYQWMDAQAGWNHWVMIANIGASMLVLFGILSAVLIFMERGHKFEWVEKHSDEAMFVVYSLIVYYIFRGVVQNGLGYEPIEIWLLTDLTGLAPELVIIGFFITWLLKIFLKEPVVAKTLCSIFFIKTDEENEKILKTIRRMFFIKEKESVA